MLHPDLYSAVVLSAADIAERDNIRQRQLNSHEQLNPARVCSAQPNEFSLLTLIRQHCGFLFVSVQHW